MVNNGTWSMLVTFVTLIRFYKIAKPNINKDCVQCTLGHFYRCMYYMTPHNVMDSNDKWVIEKLYWQQTATVRFGDEYSEFFQIERGVRQGAFIIKTIQLVYRKDL